MVKRKSTSIESVEAEIVRKEAFDIYERVLKRLENYPFNVFDVMFYYEEKDKYDREQNEE